MKKIYLVIVGLMLTAGVFAQAPEKMSYQAVVRNASNNLTINQAVGMQISILKGGVTGTAVYVETQTPTTNTNGLVSLEIGTGTLISGDFTTIDWTNDTYFIKTETDPIGGTTYTITGTNQLMSVPYALYAKTSGSSTAGPAGPSGTIGAAGPSGAAGEKGETGTAGTNGAKGDPGITGDVGAKGDPGATGFDGSTGATGLDGNTGATGLDGNTGATGLDGNTVMNGETGATGATGFDGSTGATGLDGNTGATGLDGNTGATGSNGLDGATGATGETVMNGETGATGATGFDGSTGATGLDGNTGATGFDGNTGAQGATGPIGLSGGGFIVTQISEDTTITTADQIVILTGAITVTLPEAPVQGQIVYLSTGSNAPSAKTADSSLVPSIDPNNKLINYGGSYSNSAETFDWYGLGTWSVQLVYSGTEWYVLNILQN
jgi:hypothetical protein